MTTTTSADLAVSSSVERPKDITLTLAQQKAYDELWNYLTTYKSKHPAAVLKGYAGTGKTTLLSHLIKQTTKEITARVGVTAPTHKAVKVLKERAIKGISYRTIHSMLGLKEQRNYTTGEISFVPDSRSNKEPAIAGLEVLIVDETSMLSSELFNHLVPWMKNGLKVIFVGDPVQIPPVNETDAIPFLKGAEWGMLTLELTEIIRQKSGSPVLDLATAIRQDYQRGYFAPQHHLKPEDDRLQLMKVDSEEEYALLEQFATEQFEQNADYMKVIAWRNKTVDSYNDLVRSIIYRDVKDEVNAIMIGEKLIMDAPFVTNKYTTIANNTELEVLYATPAFLSVSYLDKEGLSQEVGVKYYDTRIRYYEDTEMKECKIPIVHENSREEMQKLLAKLRTLAIRAPFEWKSRMWKQYYRIVEAFAWVKYNYAITGHKSQGSTYNQALVLKWDIDCNPNIEERNRILYVACTRISNNLYIEP